MKESGLTTIGRVAENESIREVGDKLFVENMLRLRYRAVIKYSTACDVGMTS